MFSNPHGDIGLLIMFIIGAWYILFNDEEKVIVLNLLKKVKIFNKKVK